MKCAADIGCNPAPLECARTQATSQVRHPMHLLGSAITNVFMSSPACSRRRVALALRSTIQLELQTKVRRYFRPQGSFRCPAKSVSVAHRAQRHPHGCSRAGNGRRVPTTFGESTHCIRPGPPPRGSPPCPPPHLYPPRPVQESCAPFAQAPARGNFPALLRHPEVGPTLFPPAARSCWDQSRHRRAGCCRFPPPEPFPAAV